MADKYILFGVFCCVALNGRFANGLIVPEELPSLLSVAYSNIPPIKKGTDSRVGFGFALGNHADFQVMFELGPQTNTAPVGSSFAAGSKRHIKQSQVPKTRVGEKVSQTEAGQYLQQWAQKMKNGNSNQPAFQPSPIPGAPELQSQDNDELFNIEDAVVDLHKNSKGEFEIRQPPSASMPAEILYQLQKLYGTDDSKSDKKTEIKVENSDGYDSDRLTRFEIDENGGDRTEDELRKVTEELSNVNIDE